MDETSQDLVRFDSYDQVSDALRPELAARFDKLYKSIESYVDGSFGDVDPRHAAVAVQILKELGRLYRVYDRPQTVVEGFTEEQVQARIADAVSAAVNQARIEWELARQVQGGVDRDRVRELVRRAS